MSARLRESPSERRISRLAGSAFWIVVPVALSLFVYRKLVNVYFNSDDFLNLYYIVNRAPLDYVLRPHGGHMLMFRNVIFWLSFQLFGAYPEFYQATVLLTHLLNVALLYLLVWRLTANGIASALVATFWGICPVHSGTIGWYCVYGQVLVATFMLVLLNHAVRCQTDGRTLPWHTFVTWPLLLVLAGTSFGTGIGVMLVAPAVLFLLLPASPRRLALCAVLAVLALSTPYLYSQALALHQWYSGSSSEGFSAAIAFQQRTITLHHIAMVAYLFAGGVSMLILNFLGPVDQFPPAAPIIAGVFVVLALVAALASERRNRAALVSFTVLAIGCYGIIAQGRAQFFEAHELGIGAAQARYHYAATVPFAAMLGIIVATGCARLRVGGGAQVLLLVVCLSVAGWSYRNSAPFLDLFPNARKETLIVINTVLKKVGQAWRVREVFIRNSPFRAIGTLYVRNQIAFPGWAAVYTIFFPTNEVVGKRVYFVDREPAVAVAAQKGRRSAGLIIAERDLRPCEYP